MGTTSFFLLLGGVGAAVIVIIGLIIFLAVIRKAGRERQEYVQQRFAGKKILLSDKLANFFGQESAGVSQIRGNGILILAEDELFFLMLLPKREVSVPLGSITGIETPSSFLAKSVGRALLQVNFTSEVGETDSIAWYTSKLEDFQRELTRVCKIKD